MDGALAVAHDKHQQLVSYKGPLLNLALMCSGPSTVDESSLPGAWCTRMCLDACVAYIKKKGEGERQRNKQ